MPVAIQKDLNELSAAISKKNNDDIVLRTDYPMKTPEQFRRAAYIKVMSWEGR